MEYPVVPLTAMEYLKLLAGALILLYLMKGFFWCLKKTMSSRFMCFCKMTVYYFLLVGAVYFFLAVFHGATLLWKDFSWALLMSYAAIAAVPVAMMVFGFRMRQELENQRESRG